MGNLPLSSSFCRTAYGKQPTSHPADPTLLVPYPFVCKSKPAPVRRSYIKLVKAYEIVFFDLSDVIVLEVYDHCVFSDLLGDGDLTCLVKETQD